jgi:hypothetical protein
LILNENSLSKIVRDEKIEVKFMKRDEKRGKGGNCQNSIYFFF